MPTTSTLTAAALFLGIVLIAGTDLYNAHHNNQLLTNHSLGPQAPNNADHRDTLDRASHSITFNLILNLVCLAISLLLLLLPHKAAPTVLPLVIALLGLFLLRCSDCSLFRTLHHLDPNYIPHFSCDAYDAVHAHTHTDRYSLTLLTSIAIVLVSFCNLALH